MLWTVQAAIGRAESPHRGPFLRLHLETDSGSENKNLTVLSLLAELVWRGTLDEVIVLNLMPGHTADLDDQLFSTFKKPLWSKDVRSVHAALMPAVKRERRRGFKIAFNMLDCVVDFAARYSPHRHLLKFIRTPRVMRIARSAPGARPLLWWKSSPRDTGPWLGEVAADGRPGACGLIILDTLPEGPLQPMPAASFASAELTSALKRATIGVTRSELEALQRIVASQCFDVQLLEEKLHCGQIGQKALLHAPAVEVSPNAQYRPADPTPVIVRYIQQPPTDPWLETVTATRTSTTAVATLARTVSAAQHRAQSALRRALHRRIKQPPTNRARSLTAPPSMKSALSGPSRASPGLSSIFLRRSLSDAGRLTRYNTGPIIKIPPVSPAEARRMRSHRDFGPRLLDAAATGADSVISPVLSAAARASDAADIGGARRRSSRGARAQSVAAAPPLSSRPRRKPHPTQQMQDYM
jgi:hypothetical protein